MHRLIAAAAVAVLSGTGIAQAEGVRPAENCQQALEGLSETDGALLGAWVMGYLDKTNGQAGLVRLDNARTVLRNLSEICAKNPQASILAIVQASEQNTPDTPGTKAAAEAFLRQFLAPDADLAALTTALKPTEEEIRAVYAEPLASRLVAMYDEMFPPGVSIGPNQGQTDLLVWRGTTESLRRGDPVLEDFPGGYGDVREFIQGDYPIVRFKFVKPGETIGMAFDGLIHINGRWVLMPKPWRA